MSNRTSNYPNAQQPDLKPGEMGELIAHMEQLRSLPAVREPDEVKERVKWFFQWCIDGEVRPGVELLALSLGYTRQTLLNWQHEGGVRGEIITAAKQGIAALTEQWGLTGKLNPAAFCFILKNHFNYVDNVTIDTPQNQGNRPTQTAQQIAARHAAALDVPDMEPPEL